MAYVFGARSRYRLQGVHPDLAAVANRAIQISEIDFAVAEGLRTTERQAELVKAGASKMMNSRHITGHAIDLAAFVGGELRWDWPLYYKIAAAMKIAAAELGVPIEWGAVWDRRMSDLGTNLQNEVMMYAARHKGDDLLDGPHFQLPRKEYPA